jgi:16S rRNA (cytidine1402-2'-O)-methyltransferase
MGAPELDMAKSAGRLYVVATPIGNLEDLSERAARTLRDVDLIAAEDTRHSAKLLHHLGLQKPMLALHQFNEHNQSQELLERLRHGESIALISDAGTPLISDPGFDLVRAAREAGLAVVAIPGPTALAAALSVAGLPCDRFVFEGFLPAKTTARQKVLHGFLREERTVVCYESSHRIAETLDDIVVVLGAERHIAVARELTKIHEEVWSGPGGDAPTWLDQNPARQLGEFVILIAGAPQPEKAGTAMVEVDALLDALLMTLPLSQAAHVAADLTGIKKNQLYDRALQLQGRKSAAGESA